MKIILILLILFLPVLIYAQDESSKQVMMTFEGGRTGLYKATFEFIELPEPLKISKVKYNIEAMYDIDNHIDFSKLYMNHFKGKVRIISDTIIVLPQEMSKGEIFSGYIDFIPLSSGFMSIGLSLRSSISSGEPEIIFSWCLDENGVLQYLGNPISNPCKNNCNSVITQFFDSDSVFISNTGSGILVWWNVVIKPIPRSGDTSVVYYHFTAKDNFPDGTDLEIRSKNIEIIDFQNAPSSIISKGENFEYEIKIIPVEGYTEHKLSLQLIRDYEDKDIARHYNQRLHCFFIMNENGELVFANDSDPIAGDKENKYYKSKSLDRNEEFKEQVRIYKDGREPFIRKSK